MIRRVLSYFFAITLLVGLFATPAGASSLQIAPLQYRDSLKTGEKKKGFVDVRNSSSQTVTAHLSVQAFRQINDDGELEYYDDTRTSSGILLDLDKVELGPHEAARVYFLLDGTKLAQGDNFAVVFAQTINQSKQATIPAVRVGTIIVLQNGTPSAHDATIGDLSAPWWQFGDSISAKMLIKNSSDAGQHTGFFPSIKMNLQPYASKDTDGPLIFAGRERQVEYRDNGSYFGPIHVTASVGGHEKSVWVFAVTGYWRWLSFLILAAVGIVVLAFYKIRQNIKLHR